MAQLNIGGSDISLNGQELGEDGKTSGERNLNFVQDTSGLFVPEGIANRTKQVGQEVEAKLADNSKNTQEMDTGMRKYLENKGYKIVSFEMKEGVEFQGEKLSAVRVKVKNREEQEIEGALMTRPTSFRNQKFKEYSKNTEYRKINNEMRGEDWGPNEEFFDTITDEEYIWIGDQRVLGQSSGIALLDYIQYKIVMEDTLGAIYDLDELRDMGLEDGEFSIDNITDEKAKRDIEMLIVIEKKLGVQIFLRNEEGKIVDLYKDWVNYRTRSNKSFVFGFNFGGLKYDDTIPGLFATKGDMVLYDGTALKRVGL